MIIPFSKDYRGPERPPPDEAMMLMALAHMKAIGRVPAQGQQVADIRHLPKLEGHPETGMPPIAPEQLQTDYPRGPFDPEITPLTPVPRPRLRKDE